MIEPSIEIVLRRRHAVRIIIRLSIVTLTIIAFAPFVWGLLHQIPYGWSTFVQRPIYTFRTELVSGGMFCTIAIVLWLLESRLVRWIVPLSKNECPQCGYSLRQLTTTRCPECGCQLGGLNVTDGKDGR